MNSFKSTEDIVQRVTGNFGRWQLRSIILIFLCKIPTAWFMACIIYTAPTAQKGDYYCRPSPLEMSRNSSWIRVIQTPLSDTQRTDREFHVDACHMYEHSLRENFKFTHGKNYTNPFTRPQINQTHFNIIPCEHFEHNSDYESLVTQFDLVCSRELLVSVTQSFHALGALIGGLIAITALKYISPRCLMLYGMLGQIVCGNLTGLVSTFALHVYYRCLTSMFCVFMYTAGQYILSDVTGGKAKTIVITLFELFWSIGLILLPGISIFFDSWNHLYVAISSSLVILVLLHKWISDSPRWLLRQNKIEKALQLLLESAAFNNREIPLDLEAQLKAYSHCLQQNARPIKYWHLWTKKELRKYIITVHWAWAIATILYNVMILMIRSLGVKHIHVNTACLRFSEMLGVFLGLYLILYTRHRWLWSGYLVLTSGFITYFIWLVPSSIKETRRVGYEMIFWIILKLANSASLSVLTTCSGELVPLEQRPILMISICSFSRFCLIFAPFISITTKIHFLIPITIFATLALSNGVLMCVMNINFWNEQQAKIPKIPTPNTYRRKSSMILLQRQSSVTSGKNSNHSSDDISNHLTISITDLWHLDQYFQSLQETESNSSEDNSTKVMQMEKF
ncbi:solute carrier family 22 member 3 isoform 1-T1 [Glossina fuscipes fuscipes]